jgi:hypothetical protein
MASKKAGDEETASMSTAPSSGRPVNGSQRSDQQLSELQQEVESYLRVAVDALLKAQLLLPPVDEQAALPEAATTAPPTAVRAGDDLPPMDVPPLPQPDDGSQATPGTQDVTNSDESGGGFPPPEPDVPPVPTPEAPAEPVSHGHPAPAGEAEGDSPKVSVDGGTGSQAPVTPGETPTPEAGQVDEASSSGAQGQPQASTPTTGGDGPAALVGVPTQTEDGQLSEELVKRVLEELTPEEVSEILGRLPPRDLARLDRDVDKLYDKVATLLSGNRKEATTAFDVLRRVRQLLLKEPEQYAEAEFLTRQVQARIHQIEQSIQWGAHYGPKLLVYEIVWMVLLAGFAMVTTVSGTAFAGWVSTLLGVAQDSDGLNWAMLFLSTLAWGGIGGVTSALWSLHYHISVARDFDPVENLWYLSQPVLGMVLGGIVYLIMASGFLIVQADLSGPGAALGARLLPAAVAVVVGFRQTVVLTLIERVVGILAPAEDQESP